MKTLRVTGLDRITVSPYRIAVRFTIDGNAPKFDRAVDEASRRIAALQAATAASDLDPNDLRTAAYRIEEVTEYRDGRHVRLG